MIDPDDIPLEALYPDLAAIAGRCGIDVARKLVAEYGGIKIWVPRNWRDGPHRPLERLDATAAQAVCEAIGGDSIEVPTRLFTPAGLRCMIRLMADAGAPMPDIARALHCSYRTIRDELRSSGKRIRTRVTDDRQIDLFLGEGGAAPLT